MKAALALCLLLVACQRAHDADPLADAAIASDAGHARLGRPEQCNDIDDDLDGKRDEGCPIRVLQDVGLPYYFSLADDGTQAVYMDFHAQATPDAGVPIVHVGLADGARRVVYDAADGMYPSVSGAWLTIEAFNQPYFWLLALPSGSMEQIDHPIGHLSYRPRQAGTHLVWSQDSATSSWPETVYAYDISARTTRSFVGYLHPWVVGELLALEVGHSETSASIGIAVVDLATPDAAPRHLAPAPGQRQELFTIADVSSEWILVLEGTRSEECEATAWRVSDGARLSFGERRHDCDDPSAIGSRWAAIERDPSGASDLWIVELDTLRESQVTRYPRRSTAAQFRGDTLYWLDDRHGTWDLYRMDLSDFDAGDFAPEGYRLP